MDNRRLLVSFYLVFLKMYTLFGLFATFSSLQLTVVSADRGLSCLEKPCSCCKTGNCVETNSGVLQCDSCIDGYTGLRCEEPCPKNCFNCSQQFYLKNERKCYRCNSGFYSGFFQDLKDQPNQQDCSLPCADNCVECISYYNCTHCKKDYYITDGGTCEQCPSNCKACLQGKGCVACNDRFVWTGEKCQPRSLNCIECMLNGECRECDHGYYLEDGGCMQCRQGCLSCKGILKCSRCQKGFFLKGGDCEVCQCSCEECTLDERKGFECLKCRNGFFLSDTSCRECPTGCLKCKSKDLCEVCDSGYILYDQSCHKCSRSCISCSSLDNCLECKPAFYKVSGICYRCPKNCASCLRESVCEVCKDGFWGSKCDKSCRDGCIDKNCNKETGTCLDGCLVGFSSANCSTGLESGSHNLTDAENRYVIVVSVVSSVITEVIIGAITVCLIYAYMKRKFWLPLLRRYLDFCLKRHRRETVLVETNQLHSLSTSVEVLNTEYNSEQLLPPPDLNTFNGRNDESDEEYCQ